MTTALDIITQSMKDIGVLGVGQTLRAEDVNDGFLKLNWMIGQWQVQRWMVFHLVTLNLTSTGALTYSIGPTGDFVLPAAPDKIESAFVRNLQTSGSNLVDYPLEVILAREDYNLIAIKALQTFPKWVFLDSNYPNGTLYFWPVPQSGIYAMYVSVKAILNEFSSLTTVLNLPAHYFMALCYNLSLLLAPAYGRKLDPMLVMQARKALGVVKMANYQIGRLQMPRELVRKGVFDIYSGRVL